MSRGITLIELLVGMVTAAILASVCAEVLLIGIKTYRYADRQTASLTATRKVLMGDGARLGGFEVAYQRFFDFLPGVWSGLGVQANYTYIQNHGISNSNLKVASGAASGATRWRSRSARVHKAPGASSTISANSSCRPIARPL